MSIARGPAPIDRSPPRARRTRAASAPGSVALQVPETPGPGPPGAPRAAFEKPPLKRPGALIMSHHHDSPPPAPPVTTGGVAEHGPMEITAEDGNRFSAYRAVPA